MIEGIEPHVTRTLWRSKPTLDVPSNDHQVPTKPLDRQVFPPLRAPLSRCQEIDVALGPADDSALRSQNLSVIFLSMLKLRLLLALLAFGLLLQSNAIAQKDPEAEEFQALRQEIMKLQAGQARIRKELQEIKGLVRGGARRPPQAKFSPTVIDVASNPTKGEKNARVTLIDFTDYE